MTTRRERAYDRKLRELIENTGRLRGEEVARAVGLLEDLRKQVAARIASTEWEAHHIPELKQAVEDAVDAFRRRYETAAAGALANMWDAGQDVVDVPLGTVGIRIAAPEISRTALEIMQGYSVDLIKGLSGDIVKQVNHEIALGIMGGKTPYQVMTAIGRNVDAGRFKSLSYRAEMITRTEMGRVNSAARQARLRAVSGNTEPKIRMMKKWISSGKPNARPKHARLNGKTVAVNKNYPGGIPYPHAPGLSAAEVVNCGCTHVPYSPDWGKLPDKWRPEPVQPRAEYRTGTMIHN